MYFLFDALWKIGVFEIFGDVGKIVYELEGEHVSCVMNMKREDLTPLLPDERYRLFNRRSDGWLEERPDELETLIRCEYSLY